MKRKKWILIALLIIIGITSTILYTHYKIEKKNIEKNTVRLPEGTGIDLDEACVGWMEVAYTEERLEKKYLEKVQTICIKSLDESNYKEIAELIKKMDNLKVIELEFCEEYTIDMEYISELGLEKRKISVNILGYDGRSLQNLANIKEIEQLDIYVDGNSTIACNYLANVKKLRVTRGKITEESGIDTMKSLEWICLAETTIEGFGDCFGLNLITKISMFSVEGEDFIGIANIPNEFELYMEGGNISQMAWESLEMAKIKELSINSMKLESFEFAKKIECLKSLIYKYGREYVDISALQQLEKICLSSKTIGQQEADMLSQLSNIKSISLEGECEIQDYSGLQKLPYLEEFYINEEKVNINSK